MCIYIYINDIYTYVYINDGKAVCQICLLSYIQHMKNITEKSGFASRGVLMADLQPSPIRRLISPSD